MTQALKQHKKERFLEALAECGVVGYACKAAQIDRSTAYEWRDGDEAFAAAWAVALKNACDRLEREVFRRAHDGVKRPVYQNGKCVGFVQEYSDDLAKFLLRAHNRERFGEKREITGPGGGPLLIERRSADAELAAWEAAQEERDA